MATTIELHGQLARVTDGVWDSPDTSLAQRLNGIQRDLEDKVEGYKPNRDFQRAQHMLAYLDYGRVVRDDPPDEEHVRGRVY